MGAVTTKRAVDFCRALSVSGGESMVATAAAQTSVWLALEYCGAWAAKAYAAADLPDVTRWCVDRWAAMLPGTRIQLIRNDGTRASGPFTLYVGWSGPRPGLVEVRLSRYEDVEAIDGPAIVEALRAGEPPPIGTVPDRPVVLVCTNGKRDRCCAKWGTAVYERVREDPRVIGWQTTHLGGHRFAATLVVLPEGLCYGRMEAEDVEPLLTAHVGREIWLERFRGRTWLPSAAQAAEQFLRLELGDRDLGTIGLRSIEPLDPDAALERWRVVLDSPAGLYGLDVARRVDDAAAPPSCGEEPSPLTRWVADRIAPVE